MLLYGREYLKHNCATIEQPEYIAYIYVYYKPTLDHVSWWAMERLYSTTMFTLSISRGMTTATSMAHLTAVLLQAKLGCIASWLNDAHNIHSHCR